MAGISSKRHVATKLDQLTMQTQYLPFLFRHSEAIKKIPKLVILKKRVPTAEHLFETMNY